MMRNAMWPSMLSRSFDLIASTLKSKSPTATSISSTSTHVSTPGWSDQHGLWSMVYGLWSMVYGLYLWSKNWNTYVTPLSRCRLQDGVALSARYRSLLDIESHQPECVLSLCLRH